MSKRTVSELIVDTGSRDADDLEDMACVGHSLLAAIATIRHVGSSYANWTWADGPAEIVTDLFNDLHGKEAELTRLRAEVGSVTAEGIEWRDKFIAAQARIKELEAALAIAEAEVARVQSDRQFIIGFNAGWDEALAQNLRFPTMLRKMWSGQEVQNWIREQMDAALRSHTEGEG